MKLAFICGSGYGRSDSLIITRKLRLLADDNESEVFVFIRGSEGNDKYREIAKNGAHKVFVCDTGLNSFIEMCRLWIIRNDIHMMAFQDTEEGRKMASVLAMMLDGGLTADCINIEYDKKDGFQFFRAAFSDSIVAKIKCINTDYQLCTIKQNSFQIKKELSYETGNIEYLKPEKEVKEALAQVISSKKIEKKSVSLVNAERLFCFGRGIGSKEESDKLRTLAKLCNAEISGTRAVVENELIEKEYQIGQSGICVSPKLYVGFGVSGASQHVIGIKNSKVIIAVNNDANAPIFDYSDYVIIEDCKEFLNCLLEKIEHY